MRQSIKVSRGDVVGIGKFKIPRTKEFDYEIQLLSFLSIKESENSFISTCIHLRIDGYGKTVDEADDDMMNNVSFFLSQNFSQLSAKDAWDNLRDLFRSDEWSNELCTAYHEVQVLLSMQGKQFIDPAAELFINFSQLMKLTQKENELKSWESDLEKTRKELENWKSVLKDRESELENRIGFIDNYSLVLTYLMSKMRLAGNI